MQRYSINKITYDYLELTLVYSKEEYLDIINKKEINIKDLDVELSNISFDRINFLFGISFDIYNVVGDALLRSATPSVKILNEDSEDEIVCVCSVPIISEFYFNVPTLKKVKSKCKEIVIEDEFLEKMIGNILINNGYYTRKIVSESKENTEIFIDFNGRIKKVSELIEEDENSLLSSTLNKKVGDEIILKDKVGSVNSYKVSNIVELKPLVLTNDIVCKLNFENSKDVQTFKETLRKVYKDFLSFSQIIGVAYNVMKSTNDVKISKYTLEHYKTDRTINKEDYSNEKLYDIIKEDIINQKIEDVCDNNNYDWHKLDNYMKKEFELFSLQKGIYTFDFEDFVMNRSIEMQIYTIIDEMEE